MLFIDEHGSYVSTDFLQKAFDNKILIAIYSPHTTHRLQPLDAGCFTPLATCYSQNLEAFTNSSGARKTSSRSFGQLSKRRSQKPIYSPSEKRMALCFRVLQWYLAGSNNSFLRLSSTQDDYEAVLLLIGTLRLSKDSSEGLLADSPMGKEEGC